MTGCAGVGALAAGPSATTLRAVLRSCRAWARSLAVASRDGVACALATGWGRAIKPAAISVAATGSAQVVCLDFTVFLCTFAYWEGRFRTIGACHLDDKVYRDAFVAHSVKTFVCNCFCVVLATGCKGCARGRAVGQGRRLANKKACYRCVAGFLCPVGFDLVGPE